MGAQLRLPIFSITAAEIRERLAHLQLWAAASRQGLPYYEVDWREPFALVIGSESHGIDPAIQSICNGQTCIPMPGDIDSLNAGIATAIFLFETVRQRGGS
jgi:tRNA G18 (ribose-2'-O)-methylase SpoU